MLLPLQDMTAGQLGRNTAAYPSSMQPALPVTAARKGPASSSGQHVDTAGFPSRPGANAPAAAGTSNRAPVIRLAALSQHLPAGGQLEMLVPGDGGLCGIIYSMEAAEVSFCYASHLRLMLVCND